MLQITSGSTANKSISAVKINMVGVCKIIEEPNSKEYRMRFLTLRAMLVFAKLMHTFSIALILRHFDLKYYIWIEIDISEHAIVKTLSQLTSDDFGQWYLVVFFYQKMKIVNT